MDNYKLFQQTIALLLTSSTQYQQYQFFLNDNNRFRLIEIEIIIHLLYILHEYYKYYNLYYYAYNNLSITSHTSILRINETKNEIRDLPGQIKIHLPSREIVIIIKRILLSTVKSILDNCLHERQQNER